MSDKTDPSLSLPVTGAAGKEKPLPSLCTTSHSPSASPLSEPLQQGQSAATKEKKTPKHSLASNKQRR